MSIVLHLEQQVTYYEHLQKQTWLKFHLVFKNKLITLRKACLQNEVFDSRSLRTLRCSHKVQAKYNSK